MAGQRRVVRIAFGFVIVGVAFVVLGAGTAILAVLSGFGAYGNGDYDATGPDQMFTAAKVLFVAGAILTPLAGMATAALWRSDDGPDRRGEG